MPSVLAEIEDDLTFADPVLLPDVHGRLGDVQVDPGPEGVDALRPIEHSVIPDRIEAGTFLVAGALPGNDVTVRGCVAEHQEALVEKLRAVGAAVAPVEGGLRVVGDGRPRPVDVKTAPHPGFPTDMQAQMMVLLCLAEGSSKITETVFENRFMHVQELIRLGADIAVDGKVALVKGVPALSGAPVMASDLRASAALVVAGLAAQGLTEVLRVYHLDRGYERIEEKLAPLGARIRRVKA